MTSIRSSAPRIVIAAFGAALLATILSLAGSAPTAIAPAPATSLPAAATAATPSPTSTLTTNVPEVDGARAMEHLAFFVDPARRGRSSGSAGFEASARYVADRFAEIGLEPWGDAGTYFMRFRMPLVDLAATPALARTDGAGRTYRHRADFTERVGGTFGSGTVEGPLVFIGSGVTTGASDFDAVDVRGRVAIVLTGGRTDPGRELASRGAAGAIYVTSGSLLKFSYIARFDGATIPAVVVTSRVADELLAPSGKTVSDLVAAVQEQLRRAGSSPPPPSPAFELPERIRLSVPLTPVREVEAVNVVGLLRGTDTEAAKRAVLVGGHLDGVGTDPDGTVFPGANDNASGPALTIEVARALAGRRSELRSSAVFVAWSGEEQGLNGSDAFAARFASLPGRRESLLGYVNLDVVGCCGGAVAASTESDVMVDRVRTAAERVGVPFARGGRGSSDQESFTKRGVPAALVNWSEAGAIHTTADTIDRITPERLGTIGRVAALVSLEIAAGR